MHYFGTDGIRDVWSTLMDGRVPFLLGKALSKGERKILVARDVREHSSKIERQLVLGLLQGDAKIWLTGVLPTPALAYLASVERADFAVMITASHNPPNFNGLKVFGKCGQKLDAREEALLDEAIYTMCSSNLPATKIDDEPVEAEKLSPSLTLTPVGHRVRVVSGGEELYKKHILSMFGRFDGVKVRVDAAHGCYARLATDVFASLGADVSATNDSPCGSLVNVDCGSTHLDALASQMREGEIGFAFDGDGDRALAVVNGKPYDGDGILLALATLLKLQGKLKKKFVVGTSLSSSMLERELAAQDIALLRSDVGDKNVLATMKSSGSVLGGEKSGHVIMLDRACTGDGLLTALSLLEVKKTLGRLPDFTPYPMLEFNVPASSPEDAIKDAAFASKIDKAKEIVKNEGRLVVRPSGTEPFVRVAAECFSNSPDALFEKIKRVFFE